MDRTALLKYAEKTFGTKPDHPWEKYPENEVLRHNGSGKWYGLVMSVEKRKLGLSDDGVCDVLNIKCDPLIIGSLLKKPGFYRAYHMNKEKWISIALRSVGDDNEIKELLNLSFELTE